MNGSRRFEVGQFEARFSRTWHGWNIFYRHAPEGSTPIHQEELKSLARTWMMNHREDPRWPAQPEE